MRWNEHMVVKLHSCLASEKQVWDDFVQRYSGVSYAAVGHVFGSRGAGSTGRTTEDVAQDVFVRLVKDDYRLLRKFEPQRASLETWLTLVARSVAIDCLRKRRLETSGLDPSQIPAAEPTPDGRTVPLHPLTARHPLVLTLLFDQHR